VIEAAKSRIEVAYCRAPASKPRAETAAMEPTKTATTKAAKTAKVAATTTAAPAERQSWSARNKNRAEHGRGQQYTKTSH
jgi:hypothetical protein